MLGFKIRPVRGIASMLVGFFTPLEHNAILTLCSIRLTRCLVKAERAAITVSKIHW